MARKKTKISTLILALVAYFATSAQDPYAPALAQIEQNNPALITCNHQYQATLAENATGLAPENPEVEFGYLWGDHIRGNRKDIAVTQSFDFPTVYGRRNAVARQKDTAAQAQLRAQRHDILLQAKEHLVQLIYLNALVANCQQQAQYARQIEKSYSHLMQQGETTALDYNKARINSAETRARLETAQMERQNLLEDLRALNGGNTLDFPLSQYPEVLLPDNFDTWYAQAEEQSPALQYLRSQVQVSQSSIALARAQGLPKLSVGYQGEFVAGEGFQGVTVGVSIPLWENRHRVRHTKANALAEQAAFDDAKIQFLAQLQGQYRRAQTLAQIDNSYTQALDTENAAALIYKALDKGQLTLLQYIEEMQYLNTVTLQRLETARDLALTIARLYSYSL